MRGLKQIIQDGLIGAVVPGSIVYSDYRQINERYKLLNMEKRKEESILIRDISKKFGNKKNIFATGLIEALGYGLVCLSISESNFTEPFLIESSLEYPIIMASFVGVVRALFNIGLNISYRSYHTEVKNLKDNLNTPQN
jgi:hypothetical protein